MSVELKVIHGALKRNERFQVVIPITKTPFVIGRSRDCDMRCHISAITARFVSPASTSTLSISRADTEFESMARSFRSPAS